MSNARLPDITWSDKNLNAAFLKWRVAIEAANNWSVKGHADFTSSLNGHALLVKGQRHGTSGIVTTTLDARVSANVMGEGVATIKAPDGEGPNQSDLGEFTVFNPYAVDIPVDTVITVIPYGSAYMLVGTDCLT